MSATRAGGRPLTVVSFIVRDKYKVNGYINAEHLIERVERGRRSPRSRHADRDNLRLIIATSAV